MQIYLIDPEAGELPLKLALDHTPLCGDEIKTENVWYVVVKRCFEKRENEWALVLSLRKILENENVAEASH